MNQITKREGKLNSIKQCGRRQQALESLSALKNCIKNKSVSECVHVKVYDASMCNERVCERAKEREGTYITSAETAQLSILFRVSAGFTTSSL